VLAKKPRCAAGRAAAVPVQMQRLVAFDSHADGEGGGATMINGPSARRSVLPATTADAPSHGVSCATNRLPECRSNVAMQLRDQHHVNP
jgi:hypothetical protein